MFNQSFTRQTTNNKPEKKQNSHIFFREEERKKKNYIVYVDLRIQFHIDKLDIIERQVVKYAETKTRVRIKIQTNLIIMPFDESSFDAVNTTQFSFSRIIFLILI